MDYVCGLVFVVDDELMIGEVVFVYLECVGYETRVVVDGYAVLELVVECRLDLIVFDFMFFGFDGLEVMRCVCYCMMVIILLIVKGEESDCVIGLRLGVDDYVVKLFLLVELVVRVDAVLWCVDIVLDCVLVLIFGVLEFDLGAC